MLRWGKGQNPNKQLIYHKLQGNVVIDFIILVYFSIIIICFFEIINKKLLSF